MSLFPIDFAPLEYQGMSIITAICMAFMVAAGLYINTAIQKRLDYNKMMIEKLEQDLTSIKINVAETNAIIKGLKNSLSEIAKTNQEVLKMLFRQEGRNEDKYS